MRINTRRRARVRTFDLTPMIDIVFQLIIFFLFTSQFTELASEEVDLPEQRGEPVAARAPAAVVIDLTADGRILVDGTAHTEESLRAAVLSAGGEGGGPRVRLRIDRSVRGERFNRVLRLLRSCGVTSVTWAVRPPDGA